MRRSKATKLHDLQPDCLDAQATLKTYDKTEAKPTQSSPRITKLSGIAGIEEVKKKDVWDP
jgi:hypothetical protein